MAAAHGGRGRAARCSSSRTARRWCGPPRASSRRGSACAPRRSCPSTTSSSSVAGRPAWRRRSTAPPRACARCSWSATRRAGRPGQSSRIENYLGFPSGLSGADLARRATAQARRLGAEMLTAREVVGIRENGPSRVVTLDGGEEIGCPQRARRDGRALRPARRPRGRGAHRLGRLLRRRARPRPPRSRARTWSWWARRTRPARRWSTSPTRARRVTVLCRADGLEKSMSHYLVERIRSLPNVEVRTARGGHGGVRRRTASRS